MAGNLITHLTSSEGTGYSLTLFLSTLRYVPALLESSEALYDATNLLVPTWLQLCRGANKQDVLSLVSYNRALRSLQEALNDPQKRTSSATLGATIYLQMTEYSFDYSKGVNQVSRCNGIYAITMERGPPKLRDKLGYQLILDSFAFMSRLVKDEIDNFFTQPDWENALVSLSDQYEEQTPTIHQSTILADALEILSAALDDIRANFRALDKNTVLLLVRSNIIYEEDDPESPFGTSYVFPDGITALLFTNVASFNIVINTLRQELNTVIGIDGDDSSLDAECLEWSGRIWKSCRYILSLKPLCAASFNSRICVSYMFSGPSERACLLDVLKETDGYRKQAVSRWSESVVFSQYNGLLGRRPEERQ
ncbi:hypothetical protein F4811DRAFT_550924 [Daldinia bambusicola]|nr:hypothetical protein F4811DRAFT_550924 [Daldinia bambusicola]